MNPKTSPKFPMIRLILLTLVMFSAGTSTATAEEFLLRMEQLGFIDKSEPDAREETLRVMEVVVHSDSRFRSKVIVGKETLILAGKLVSKPDGKFRLEVRHHCSIDTGQTVINRRGGQDSVLDENGFGTTLEMTLAEPVQAGGFETKSTSKKGEIKSRLRYMVTLTKYVPDDH